MVVLAASICTRGGKAIISRQFRELTKDRVTALLAAFPLLLTSSSNQHTTVEDEHVRYVYQPLEELYIVLITNRQSNILQDIDTIHLLAQLVSSIIRSVDEREVLDNAFEIIEAFDETLALGYRENLTLSQVKTFLQMESHEEKIQEIIERNKELEAAEERKRIAKEMQKAEIRRREMARKGFSETPHPGSNYGGFGSQPGYSGPSGVGMTASVGNGLSVDYSEESPKLADAYPSAQRQAPKNKGLQLGGKKSKFSAARTEAGIDDTVDAPLLAAKPEVAEAAPQVAAPLGGAVDAPTEPENNGILITVAEKISAKISRDGDVQSSEVKGNLLLRIADPEKAHVKILASAEGQSIGAQYKTHPNVDRAAFTKNSVITLKNPSRPFPSNDQSLGVLRWTVPGKEPADLVPLTFTVWTSPEDAEFFDVTVEYEVAPWFTEPLKNVEVLIPVPSTNLSISDDSEDIEYNQYEDHLQWIIPEITPGADNASGSFQFTCEASSDEEFFPMHVRFTAGDVLTSIGKVDVRDVVAVQDESQSVEFKKIGTLTTDEYLIV